MIDYRIVASAHGGPQVMRREPISELTPAPGEVIIRQRAIGVNFVDTYHRSGFYPGPVPAPLGGEAAGVVEAVGPDVTDFAPGERVGYGTGGQGAYATLRAMPAEHLFHLPAWLSDDDAAALLLKGLTAAYLVGPCANVQAGQTVVVHAAAGGVGSILVPWLARLGARIVAHVGADEKADRVRVAGAQLVLSGPIDAIPAAVRAFNPDGAAIVFDGVGSATWDASLASLACRGLMVTFGNASGPPPSFSALDLSRAGSLFVTRPTLRDYARSAAERGKLASALFAQIEAGIIAARIGLRLPLERAADAHRALESRQTTGAIVLHP